MGGEEEIVRIAKRLDKMVAKKSAERVLGLSAACDVSSCCWKVCSAIVEIGKK